MGISLWHTPVGDKASHGTKLCVAAQRYEHHSCLTCVNVFLDLLSLGFSRELCIQPDPSLTRLMIT